MKIANISNMNSSSIVKTISTCLIPASIFMTSCIDKNNKLDKTPQNDIFVKSEQNTNSKKDLIINTTIDKNGYTVLSYKDGTKERFAINKGLYLNESFYPNGKLKSKFFIEGEGNYCSAFEISIYDKDGKQSFNDSYTMLCGNDLSKYEKRDKDGRLIKDYYGVYAYGKDDSYTYTTTSDKCKVVEYYDKDSNLEKVVTLGENGEITTIESDNDTEFLNKINAPKEFIKRFIEAYGM